MKVVGPLMRSIQTYPGHDCLFAKCLHPVKGDHGIHSDDDCLIVRAELEDGRNAALVLTLFSGRYPSTIPAEWLARDTSMYPRASDLSLHVQRPRGTHGHPCEFFGGQSPCMIADTGALKAVDIFAGFPSGGTVEGRRRQEAVPANQWRHRYEAAKQIGSPNPINTAVARELWERLEARFVELVGTVDLTS